MSIFSFGVSAQRTTELDSLPLQPLWSKTVIPCRSKYAGDSDHLLIQLSPSDLRHGGQAGKHAAPTGSAAAIAFEMVYVATGPLIHFSP
jgi:hypothetical protein